MWNTLQADLARYHELLPADFGRWRRFLFFLGCQGMWALADYRFRQGLVQAPGWVRFLLRVPVFFSHLLIESLTGIYLPTASRIGKGLYIGHFCGIFVHPDVVMGENCSLSQGVTLGLGGKGERLGVPQVGNRVYFGAGAKAFGKITIGDGAAVGANAVVIDSVPAGATAVGVPARVIPRSTNPVQKGSGTF